MPQILLKALFLGTLLFVLTSAVNAQSQVVSENKQPNIIVVGAKKTVAISGKVAYAVVKETANVAWETTKFTTKEVAAPIAKTLLIKATPKITKFLLKKSIPVSKKLIIGLGFK